MYARKKAGLSQIDLAEILGVSRQSISKWETDESNPDISKLTTIAKTLTVSTDWLLSEEDVVQVESEAEEKGGHIFANQKQYPDWVDHLPKFTVGMVKKYGWLYGARTAVGGLIFTLFGIFTRFLLHSFIFGSSNSFDPFAEIHQKAWSGFSAITGFAIVIGVATTIFGVVLAVSLKNWGSKDE